MTTSGAAAGGVHGCRTAHGTPGRRPHDTNTLYHRDTAFHRAKRRGVLLRSVHARGSQTYQEVQMKGCVPMDYARAKREYARAKREYARAQPSEIT